MGDGRAVTTAAPRRVWLGTLALMLAILGALLCVGALAAVLAPRLWAGAGLPSVLLSPDWLPLAWLSSLAGVVPAVAGLAVGIAGLLGLVRTRTGERSGRCRAAVVLGLLALVAAGVAQLLLTQSPYSLYGLRQPASATRLDALGAAEVVRTYLTSGDLSVQYWLRDAEGRLYWHQSNAGMNPSLGTPASDVRISPLRDTSRRDDATHRAFRVSFTTHAPNGLGEPPGHQSGAALLTRESGGSWRISYLGRWPVP